MFHAKWSRYYLGLCAASLYLTLSANAAAPVKAPVAPVQPIQASISKTENEMHDNHNKTTNPAPNSFFFEGRFLLWHSTVDGLEYVETNSTTPNMTRAGIEPADTISEPLIPILASSNLYNAREISPSFSWDPGFGLSFGWRSPHDDWRLMFDWDHITNYGHDEITAPTTTAPSLFPLWSAVSTVFTAKTRVNLSIPTTPPYTFDWLSYEDLIGYIPLSVVKAKSKWKMHFDLVDVGLEHDFKMSPWLTLTPSIGVEGGFISQFYDIQYTGGVFQTNLGYGELYPGIDSYPFTDFVHMSSRFWGVGPKLGFSTSWTAFQGFSIGGSASFSLLGGQFKTCQQEYMNGKDKDNSIDILDIAGSSRALVPVTDLGLNLRYDWTLERCSIGLFAGWDARVVFNQNRFNHYDANEPSIFIEVETYDVDGTDLLPTLPYDGRILDTTDTQTYAKKTPAHGDLVMQGLTVGLEISF